jgi:recombinational DNA repair ATPase RecF
MKLTELELENVYSFRDKEIIRLNNGLNVFTGPNGGGKTNLLKE